MDMAGEKDRFLSMLPGTLDALCGMRGLPHDDTILHRLLDKIICLITSPDDANSAGLFSFLDAVAKDVNNLNASVLVLALGMAAPLVSMATLPVEQRQRVMSVYNSVQSSAVMEDTSVGAAYFNSLASVVGYPMGLEWLEKNSIHMQTALSTLETAQSVFLLKAAEILVVASVTKSLESSAPTSTPSSPTSPTVVKTMQFLSDALAVMAKGSANLLDQMIVSTHVSTFHQSVGQIISLLCDGERFCKWKCGEEGFVASLARLALQHPSEKIRFSSLQSTAKLTGFMDKDAQEKFLAKEIVFPLLKLVSEGEIEREITVAATFINCSQTSATSEALSTLKKFYQMPHDILFGQQIQNKELTALAPLVTTALQDKQRFSKLISSILHSLTQTNNCDGLIRLLQSASTSRDSEDWSSLLSTWLEGIGAVVMGNQRLLNSLLHQLQQDDSLELSLVECSAALKSFLQIMKRPMVESRLYSQTCSAFLNILRKQTARCSSVESDEMREVMGQTLELLERRLVAMQWDIRDTTLEFVRSLICTVPDAWFLRLALERHLLRDAWSCLKDGESYPRASVITMATRLIMLPNWWAAFLQDCNVTEASLVDEMVKLLSEDSEAFPRRAAVQFLTALFSHFPAHPPATVYSDVAQQRHKICSAMNLFMVDLDWEVKVRLLEFWEKMATPLLSGEQGARRDEGNGEVKGSGDTGDAPGRSNTGKQRSSVTTQGKRRSDRNSEENYSMLASLLKDGFGLALLTGTEDYDTAVQQKALQILAAVEEKVTCSGHSPTKSQKLKSEVQDPLIVASNVGPQAEIGDTPKENASSVIPVDGVSSDPVAQFLHKISQLNPTRQLICLGPSSDVYDQNPSSLMEDVMAATKAAVKSSEVSLMSEDEFEDADDMFVDCY
ncbi:BRCA1-associated ATM activator 1-like [Littorina saxatilis]|uniref:Uncharacterized protein n=1 Tax=Littorina saxatilis TaxID=31220 RepID=A0AAN9BV44_9CAEN